MADQLQNVTGKTTGSNVLLYDADGYPVSFVAGAIPVSIVSGYASPLGKYVLSDSDDAELIRYYGFLDTSGSWYIRKEDSASGSQRFVAGSSGYAAAWATRADQTYGYFDAIF